MADWIANIGGTVDDTNPEANATPIMAKVCAQCPWGKKDSGTYRAYPAHTELIFNIVDTRTPMACHMSQTELLAFTEQKGLHRCRGIEIYRSNTGIKSELEPDTEEVFANKEEAQAFWPNYPRDWNAYREKFFATYPDGKFIDPDGSHWEAGKRVDV